jgi:monovalent cation/hydrogen antiporter
MTLLGGESLLNDATALTAYKVSLAAAIGTAATWRGGLTTFALAAAGGVAVGVALGALTAFVRWRLDDPLTESAIGLVAPFVIYLTAEEIHGSGVLAVVVAALILGQKSTRAGYATRLQDNAVWKALTLLLESFAFLLIGLQLPMVIGELKGITAEVILISSVAVLATVIVVRIVWVFIGAYVPRLMFASVRAREPVAPPPAEVFVVAWAGMRGVVSLAAAFGVPMTTLSGAPFPGRPQLVFLTFVVVIGTLLLHGLTLPWLIRRLGVQGDDARTDAIAAAAAQDKAARAAEERLDELLAEEEVTDVHQRAADVLRSWNTRRRNSAWERLGRDAAEIGESPAAAFRRLRLEMLAAERASFIAERDNGDIDDEVLREVLRGLDLEEATLNRG